MSDEKQADRLADIGVVLTPGMSMIPVDRNDPDFYTALPRNFDGFANHALIADYAFGSDWTHWERHPNGDEFVYLLSGMITIVLWEGGREVTATLSTFGEHLIIPRGAWHTARAAEPSRALFVTPGEGTEHAEARPTD
jgi:mannose-6-phosphate isomerase-like protein (cupin superfamily)